MPFTYLLSLQNISYPLQVSEILIGDTYFENLQFTKGSFFFKLTLT